MNTKQMSAKKGVVKAGIGYTIGNYLLKGFAFITVPIFARLLTVDDYGIFSIFVTYESIFSIILGFAIHSSYKNAFYKYGTGEGKTNKECTYYEYTSNTMLLIAISGLLWLATAIIFRRILSDTLRVEPTVLILVVLYSFSSATLQCFNSDRGLRYEYKSYLKISATNAIANFTLSLALILTIFTNQRYIGRIIGTVVPMLLIALGIVGSFLKRAKPKYARSSLRWGIKYSLPIVPHGLSQIILNQFDRIMIRSMIGYTAAGQYSFAYTIYSILAVTFTSLDTVWSPWFYERMSHCDYAEIEEKSSKYVKYVCFFCTVVMLLSPELVVILGGSKYREAVYCVIPIVAGGFFVFLYYLPAGIEYYFEKTKYIAFGSAGAAVINIALNYVFINRFGYVAAAYTTLASYIVYFFFHYAISRIIFKTAVFPTKILFALTGIILAMMGVVVLLLEQPIVRWIIAGTILVLTAKDADRTFGIIEIIKNKKRRD